MAAIDLFPGSAAQSTGIDASAIHAQKTTGDDSTDLTYVSRGILVGTAGNLKVTMRGGLDVPVVTVTIPVTAGYNPLRVSRIWLTGFTAVDVTALT